MNKEPRLRFTDEERADPALEKPIRKADKAAARADKAQANVPKKKVRQTVIDPDTGKFSGIWVNNRLPDLFLWNIGLRLICSGRSFIRFADRLFQRRVSPFLIGKAQARLFIQTILPA